MARVQVSRRCVAVVSCRVGSCRVPNVEAEVWKVHASKNKAKPPTSLAPNPPPGKPPAFLTILRYASPVLLYPLGGVGEGWTMYRALDAKIGGSDVLFSTSVGGVDLSLTLSQLVTYVYFPAFVPGFLYLYVNAFGQCRKQFGRVVNELSKND